MVKGKMNVKLLHLYACDAASLDVEKDFFCFRSYMYKTCFTCGDTHCLHQL